MLLLGDAMQGTELLMKECRRDIGAPPGAFHWLNAAVARAPEAAREQ